MLVLVDLLGTFAFAVSGSLAAEQKRLDLFGVFAMSYVTACGGGIVRDLCIGALPPAGISDWRYLAVAGVASLMTFGARSLVERLKHPVILFDAIGLGFFAVAGAHKALLLGHGVEVAVLAGTVTGVGGGVARDVLLARVPVILQKEIYAVAAMAGAAVQVLGERLGWRVALTPWFAASVCVGIRLLALRRSWSLPVLGKPGPA